MKGKSKFRVWLWGTASVLGGGLGGGTKHRAGGGQRRERAGTPSCRSSTSRAIIPNQNGKQKTKNVNSIFSKTRKLLNPEPQARQEEGQRQQRQRQRVPPGRPCSGSRQQQRWAAGGTRTLRLRGRAEGAWAAESQLGSGWLGGAQRTGPSQEPRASCAREPLPMPPVPPVLPGLRRLKGATDSRRPRSSEERQVSAGPSPAAHSRPPQGSQHKKVTNRTSTAKIQIFKVKGGKKRKKQMWEEH